MISSIIVGINLYIDPVMIFILSLGRSVVPRMFDVSLMFMALHDSGSAWQQEQLRPGGPLWNCHCTPVHVHTPVLNQQSWW